MKTNVVQMNHNEPNAFTVTHEQHQQVEDITGINNDMISPSKLLLAKQRKDDIFPYKATIIQKDGFAITDKDAKDAADKKSSDVLKDA